MVTNKTKSLKDAAKQLKSKTKTKADKLLDSIHKRLEDIVEDLNKYYKMRQERMTPEETAIKKMRERYI